MKSFPPVQIFLCLFFLFQCRTIDNTSNTVITGNLIPFTEFNSAGKQKWGYLDETTGEIVIKAKYDYAYPFVGGFAYAAKSEFRNTIINRYGKVVHVGNFNMVYLFTSESGKNTLAVLKSTHRRTLLHIGLGILGSSSDSYSYMEEYFKYRLVNLVTGKTIIRKKENYLTNHIEVAGDYFLVDPDYGRTDLYQFLDNGDVKRVVKNDTALAAETLKNYLEGRGINADVSNVDRRRDDVRISYRPYIKRIFADPDLSGALKDLPPELTFIEAEPCYRGHRVLLNASLEIIERKYWLDFQIEGVKRSAVGIYNESKAEWVIKPCFTINYTDTGEKEECYITRIVQTNNPNLYHLTFTSEDHGLGNEFRMGGSLYSIIEKDFISDLYLFENYPPNKQGDILTIWGGKNNTMFPDDGVYYRDYSRMKNK